MVQNLSRYDSKKHPMKPINLFLSLFFSNLSLAQDINIQESINLSFKCDLDKKIIKNSEYNYQTFLAKDLNEKGLDKFKFIRI